MDLDHANAVIKRLFKVN